MASFNISQAITILTLTGAIEEEASRHKRENITFDLEILYITDEEQLEGGGGEKYLSNEPSEGGLTHDRTSPFRDNTGPQHGKDKVQIYKIACIHVLHS